MAKKKPKRPAPRRQQNPAANPPGAPAPQPGVRRRLRVVRRPSPPSPALAGATPHPPSTPKTPPKAIPKAPSGPLTASGWSSSADDPAEFLTLDPATAFLNGALPPAEERAYLDREFADFEKEFADIVQGELGAFSPTEEPEFPLGLFSAWERELKEDEGDLDLKRERALLAGHDLEDDDLDAWAALDFDESEEF